MIIVQPAMSSSSSKAGLCTSFCTLKPCYAIVDEGYCTLSNQFHVYLHVVNILKLFKMFCSWLLQFSIRKLSYLHTFSTIYWRPIPSNAKVHWLLLRCTIVTIQSKSTCGLLQTCCTKLHCSRVSFAGLPSATLSIWFRSATAS